VPRRQLSDRARQNKEEEVKARQEKWSDRELNSTGGKVSSFGADVSESRPDPASPRHAPTPRGFEAGETAGNDQHYGEAVTEFDMGDPTAGEQPDAERGPEQAAAGIDVRREELSHEERLYHNA
jgi:hypothetical protein